MDPLTAIALGLKLVGIAETVVDVGSQAAEDVATIKGLLQSGQQPTADQLKALDIAEQAAFEAVQNS